MLENSNVLCEYPVIGSLFSGRACHTMGFLLGIVTLKFSNFFQGFSCMSGIGDILCVRRLCSYTDISKKTFQNGGQKNW